MRKLSLFLLSALLACVSCRTSSDEKILLLRLRMPNTCTEEGWNAILSGIKNNPECCNEVWFSTGINVPAMDVHREHVKRLGHAKNDLEKLGIGASVQIQMTIGHGSACEDPAEWTAKTWTGWTGSTGVEHLYCNCPRQPEFLKYLREMTGIYAALKPRAMWIDDDLRYDNHYPASKDSRPGCWCEKCISDFSAQEGRTWTRESLDAAMSTDPALEERWKVFSLSSLVDIARIIAEETKAVSPETRMGYQKTFSYKDTTVVRTILQTLYEVSGEKVSYRPGGGAYYDNLHPAGQIIKSMDAARYMKILDCKDIVGSWCPEIETYPRHYGSRTGQSVLLEGFAALAFGADAISMFVLDNGEESPEVQSRYMLHPIHEGSQVLREYARANAGTQAAGYTTGTGNSELFDLAMTGIPVLQGDGIELLRLQAEDYKDVDIYAQTSSELQAFRNRLNEKAPAPVVCDSPFIGMVIPRVDPEGALRTLGLINCRIDAQECIRFLLPSLPGGIKTVSWRELRNKPVKLRVRQNEKGIPYVEIPRISAWNAGFLLIASS